MCTSSADRGSCVSPGAAQQSQWCDMRLAPPLSLFGESFQRKMCFPVHQYLLLFVSVLLHFRVCVCVCVKCSFSKCYSLGKDWDALFFFQMLILHSILLFFTLLLTVRPPSLNITATTHTHTLITSNVVLSVFSPVDHLVVVIEEVLCNSSIGSIIETKTLNCWWYDYYVTHYFLKLYALIRASSYRWENVCMV